MKDIKSIDDLLDEARNLIEKIDEIESNIHDDIYNEINEISEKEVLLVQNYKGDFEEKPAKEITLKQLEETIDNLLEAREFINSEVIFNLQVIEKNLIIFNGFPDFGRDEEYNKK
jgi:hypothetical protein